MQLFTVLCHISALHHEKMFTFSFMNSKYDKFYVSIFQSILGNNNIYQQKSFAFASSATR